MKVAIVAPPWVPVPPPAYGGTEAVLDNLARGLVTAGHDALLFATGDSTCDAPTRWVLDRAAGTVNTGSAIELHHVVHAYDALREWGADVVISGHEHAYERFTVDGIAYIVDGLGGGGIDRFTDGAGSAGRLRFDGDYGALRGDARSGELALTFTTRSGAIVDRYELRPR